MYDIYHNTGLEEMNLLRKKNLKYKYDLHRQDTSLCTPTLPYHLLSTLTAYVSTIHVEGRSQV